MLEVLELEQELLEEVLKGQLGKEVPEGTNEVPLLPEVPLLRVLLL